MDATRVARPRRPSVTEVMPAPLAAGTARDARTAHPAPAALGPERLEQWVLVTHVFAGERASALLEGLGVRETGGAQRLLGALAQRRSAERQARLAQVFGPAPDAPARLRDLMEEVSPVLKAEILRRLPPYYRSLFPPGAVPRAEGLAPTVAALAERLIREASR